MNYKTQMKIKVVGIGETSFIPLTKKSHKNKFVLAEKYGIVAEIRRKGGWWICPRVNSKNKGSGKFGDFLKELKEICRKKRKKLVFEAVTNDGVYRYCEKYDIPVLVKGNLYNVKTQ
jgi:hypothetical protein